MGAGFLVVLAVGGHGSAYAISITPQGWDTQPGDTIRVKVTGTSQPIEYEVHFASCGNP